MTLIIGVGNDYRGDDGVGLVVARALRAMGLPGVKVLESAGEVGAVVEALRGEERVFVVDAAHSGSSPGTIHRFDARRSPITVRTSSHSTHDLGLADAIELARALEAMPAELVVYAIEGADFRLGVSLSPSVERAGSEVVARMAEEIRGGAC